MKPTIDQFSLWDLLEYITESLKGNRLANVFRFISFKPYEKFGPHKHLRIEINYVKRGSCAICTDNENVVCHENDIMIVTPYTSHLFEASSEGCTLMQLEFLPDIYSCLNTRLFHLTMRLLSVLPKEYFSTFVEVLRYFHESTGFK